MPLWRKIAIAVATTAAIIAIAWDGNAFGIG